MNDIDKTFGIALLIYIWISVMIWKLAEKKFKYKEIPQRPLQPRHCTYSYYVYRANSLFPYNK